MAEVEIARVGLKGDGVASGPVYVPRALPGEIVAGDLHNGHMVNPRILKPSDARVKAPCVHYKSCGGCALQHASDGFVATWKVQAARIAMQAQGLDAAFLPIATSPPRSRRRATFSGRRIRSGALVGFHMRASPTIVATPDCLLLAPELRAAVPALEALTALLATRKSGISLAVTATGTGPDIDIRGGRDPGAAGLSEIADIARQFDLARVSLAGETGITRRPPVVAFDGIKVPLAPGAFLQATPQGEAALRAVVAAALGPARHIADLFSGCGTFALPLARGASVHAVEADARLTRALSAGWRGADGVKEVTVETRDLFRRPLRPDELARFDGVVLDPPRAGAHAQVAELAVAGVPRVAMVSCNPVSFARDVKRLVDAGYVPSRVQVVDQFRWSPHIEIAASLALEK